MAKKPYKPGKSFSEDWANNTVMGGIVKSAVEFAKKSTSKKEPMYPMGKKGDRENSPDSPMKRVNDATAKQKNFFSSSRLKKK